MSRLLLNHLTPSQAAYLAQNGDLPPDTRAVLGAGLRQELISCAAYVPARIVQQQLANPQPGLIHGSFWHGSILFADLSGFTVFCEYLSVLGKQGAEEVSAIVNQLFNALVAEVLAYQGDTLAFRGELLKFGGDALTAFFDSATLGPAHAAAATQAALAMQEQMAAFSSIETRAGAFRLRLRIGIHSGDVFAAEVGDTSHMELVVTGSEMSHVATAQKIAAPGEVVISEQTADLLEGARLEPKRTAGYHRVLSLPRQTIPAISSDLTPPEHNDMESLELLAHQVAALRPYLVRDLPRRFLDATVSEIGEFRLVSVLFANFYDFGMLLTRFGSDAVLAATALNAYYRRVQAVVHRYEGIINKADMFTQGDKIMALFGAPTTHEDDPLRAVRCALELRTAIEEANTEITPLVHYREVNGNATLPAAVSDNPTGSVPGSAALAPLLRHRIGINTGTVFAGRVGGTYRYEYTVMGPAVNLSARLMEVAEEGTVLISPATRAAIERHIPVRELAPLQVKGIPEPITPAYALDGEQPPASAVKTSLERAPLIGRDQELNALITEGKDALRTTGRVLALVGDVGMGKTRMTEELVRHIVLASVSPHETSAVPHFQIYTGEGQSLKQAVPYVTLRSPLSQLLGIDVQKKTGPQANWNIEELAQHIQGRVERFAPEYSHLTPLLSDVLGSALPETPLTRSLSAEQRHRRIQELVVALFHGAAASEPMMLVIDDLQWSDTLSLKILTSLAHIVTRVPLLLTLCYRADSDLPEPWADLPSTVRQVLQELSPENSYALLSAMLNAPPPPDMQTLLDRTQGNPFFIEELVRDLVASGTLRQDNTGTWTLTASPENVTMPSSIEGLIMARLDRLDEPYYELVQVASVIGQRFAYIILEGVYKHPELLLKGLQHLRETDIIQVEEKQQELTYFFRHALMRDVAYERILYSQRRELHRRVAQCIEEIMTGHTDEKLALLTRHYTLAEDWEPAFRYHLAAGVQAQHRYANQEALRLFAAALDISRHLVRATGGRRKGTGDRRQGQRDRRQADMPGLIPPTGDRRVGPVDRRTRQADRRSQLGDRRMNAVRATWHGGTDAPGSEPPDEQRRATDEDWRQRFYLTMQIVEVHEHCGEVHALMGNYEAAQASYQEALSLIHYLQSESQHWVISFNESEPMENQLATITVRIHRLLASTLEYREQYEAALNLLQQGMARSLDTSRGELARCYLLGASLQQHLGDYDTALAWAHEGLALAEQLHNTGDHAHALLLMGNLWRDRGEFDRAIPALEQARTLLDQMKDATRLSETLRNLADAYRLVGRWNDAIKCYQQSMQISENIGDVVGMARASNNLALVMLDRGILELAAELFQYSNERFGNIGSLLGLAVTGYNHGKALLLQGKARDALHLIRASIMSLERIKARNAFPEAYRLAAEATLALEDSEQSRAYASQSLDIASDLGMAVEEALALRTLGKIALYNQDYEEATRCLQRSQTMLEERENRYELGKVLFWQAHVADEQGSREAARALLEQAGALFQQLGAKRDLEMVRQLTQTLDNNENDAPISHDPMLSVC